VINIRQSLSGVYSFDGIQSIPLGEKPYLKLSYVECKKGFHVNSDKVFASEQFYALAVASKVLVQKIK
jgi:hypothetical protein